MKLTFWAIVLQVTRKTSMDTWTTACNHSNPRSSDEELKQQQILKTSASQTQNGG